MTDAAEVGSLLSERPDLEPALRHVLAVDREHDTWTFADIDVDSGSFGELVSKGVVEKVDGEYRLDDPAAVQRALEGAGGTAVDASGRAGRSSGGGRSVPSLSAGSLDVSFDVDRVAAGTLVALLGFVALLRSISFFHVFRDRVVLSGNDPYYYRYWVEQLLAQAGGSVDLSVVSGLPDTVANGEPLMVVTLWFVTTLFGGTPDAAGFVLALYPVVLAVVTGFLVYLLALRLTADRRIALAAVALFAIIPAHALRTSLGFADHHAFDYPWLVLTALSLLSLLDATDFQYDRGHLLAALGLGVGVAGQVLSWEAGPLLVLPLGVAVAAVVPVIVHEERSPLPMGVPVLTGVGLGAALTMFASVSFGWQSTSVASTPAILFLGLAGVVGVGEAFRRLDTELPTAALAGAEVAIALAAVVVIWAGIPELWSDLTSNATRLFATRGIVEVQSLFSGGSLGFLLLFGFVLVLGVPYMAWGTWRGYRGAPAWLALAVYGWYFVALAAIQLRFSGELSGFIAVFAGLGFVHLAERVDITTRPAPFRDPADRRRPDGRSVRTDGGRLPLPDRTQLFGIVALFLLVGSLGLVQVPIKVDQLSIPEDQYRTAGAIENYSDTHGMTYPQNYVYSDWGRNRMYNYFVNGEARSYGYARDRFDDVNRTDQDTFVEQTDPQTAYELVRGRPGFMVLEKQPNAPPTTMQAWLFRYHGSKFQGVPGLGHYQLVYVDPGGQYKAFRIVQGATIEGSSSEEFVWTYRTVERSGASFNYTRGTVVRNGSFTVTVAYPGTYQVGNQTVAVSADAVENGRTVQASEPA